LLEVVSAIAGTTPIVATQTFLRKAPRLADRLIRINRISGPSVNIKVRSGRWLTRDHAKVKK
jgi:hypothetical protein